MFNVTSKAANEIKRMLEQEEMSDAFLRIRIVPGGCSGFEYEMGFDNEIKQSDKVFEAEGIKVVIDELSYPYLKGATLDFSYDLNSTGFSIKNPNAAGTCGCGHSFAV